MAILQSLHTCRFTLTDARSYTDSHNRRTRDRIWRKKKNIVFWYVLLKARVSIR